MNEVRQMLKKSDTLVGVVRDLKKIGIGGKPQTPLDKREALIQSYFDSHSECRLQLGSGQTLLAGWLCTDIVPRSERVAYLDATEPFPFDDGVFDYIFSEHVIEHVSWDAGGHMLRECLRVLKPGGVARIATPDLAVLLDLYNPPLSPMKERYIKWITDTFLPEVDDYNPQFVINNAFRNWGHQFLYDQDLLERALRDNGFVNIRKCDFGQSDHPALQGVEKHGENMEAEQMVEFETMVYEAERPLISSDSSPGEGGH